MIMLLNDGLCVAQAQIQAMRQKLDEARARRVKGNQLRFKKLPHPRWSISRRGHRPDQRLTSTHVRCG